MIYDLLMFETSSPGMGHSVIISLPPCAVLFSCLIKSCLFNSGDDYLKTIRMFTGKNRSMRLVYMCGEFTFTMCSPRITCLLPTTPQGDKYFPVAKGQIEMSCISLWLCVTWGRKTKQTHSKIPYVFGCLFCTL